MTEAQREAHNARRRVAPKPKTCTVCGETFTPGRSDAQTCSARCRQALRRLRLNPKKPIRKPRPRTTARRDTTLEVPARELREGDVLVDGALAGKRIAAVTDQCPYPEPDERSTCSTRAGAWFRTKRSRTWVDRPNELVRVDRPPVREILVAFGAAK